MPPVVGSFMFIASRITKNPIIRAALSAKEMSHSGAPSCSSCSPPACAPPPTCPLALCSFSSLCSFSATDPLPRLVPVLHRDQLQPERRLDGAGINPIDRHLQARGEERVVELLDLRLQGQDAVAPGLLRQLRHEPHHRLDRDALVEEKPPD